MNRIFRKDALRRRGPRCLALCGLLCGAAGRGQDRAATSAGTAQQPELAHEASLPAPVYGPQQAIEHQGQQPAEHQPAGSVSGIVTDPVGNGIVGAQVLLAGDTVGDREPRITISDEDGRFHFPAVLPGNFKLTITSAGMSSTQSTGLVHPGEDLQVLPVAMELATTVADVEVRASEREVAAAEVKLEEKQRLVGFMPNFYVTYDWHAPPLSTRQKYGLAFKTIIDPASLLINAAVAGGQQANNSYAGYGQGAAGYGKRFGAVTADFTIGTLVGGAIVPSLLHQDPRYFYKGHGSFTSRALYALSTAVICKGDNGKWQPNYSSVIGDITSGAISNIYYPASSRNGAALIIENGLLSAAEDGIGNLVQEFVFRHFTPNVPKYGVGGP